MTKKRNKTREIQHVIARLFAQKGYHSTSMREIARELGMNQSSLYHYFDSKEDILFTLINDAMDDALERLEAICRTDQPPEGKLHEVLDFYTRYYAGDQDRLVLLVNEIPSLGETYRGILIEKQRRYLRLIQSILEELKAAGKMKDIPSTVAAFAFFGMVHYTIKWYDKEGPLDSEQLAQYFLEIFARGIFP